MSKLSTMVAEGQAPRNHFCDCTDKMQLAATKKNTNEHLDRLADMLAYWKVLIVYLPVERYLYGSVWRYSMIVTTMDLGK